MTKARRLSDSRKKPGSHPAGNARLVHPQWTRRPLALAVFCATAAGGGAVMAQTQGQGIEEIIVTATRREQSVQDIPYNITAITGDTLKDTGAVSLGDLSRLVPGMAFLDQGPVTRANNNNFVLRGINANDATNGRSIPNSTVSTVSTYLGETPVFFALTLKDIDRVEVLRGPQGTLYGNSSMGGTIRFIPTAPQLDKGFTADVSANVSTTDYSGKVNYETDVILNIPVNDRFGVRVAGGYTGLGGFIDAIRPLKDSQGIAIPRVPGDLFSGYNQGPLEKDTNGSEHWWVRGTALWDITDKLDATLLYQHEDVKQDNQQMAGDPSFHGVYDSSAKRPLGSIFDQADGCPGAPLQFYGFLPIPCNGPGGNTAYPNGSSTFPVPKKYQNFIPIEEPYKSTVDLVNLDLNFDLGFATFTSSTSYYKIKENYVFDSTGFLETPQLPNTNSVNTNYYAYFPRVLIIDLRTTNLDSVVEEARIASSWKDKPWDYVLGVYYQDSHTHTTDNAPWPGVSQFMAQFGFYSANPQLGDVTFTEDTKVDFKDTAVFGELTYHLNDRLQVTGGFRVFWQELGLDVTQTYPFCGIYCGTDALGTTNLVRKQKVQDQIFKVNTSYNITDDMMAYFTWSEGFRRGGANGIPLSGGFGSRPEYATFNPDKVENYEIGVKGSLLNNKLQYDLSAYRVDWNNFQFQAFSAGGFVFVANGKSVESQGIELDAQIRPTDLLLLNMGYAYTDSKVDKDFVLQDYSFGPGSPLVDIANVHSGSKMPNVPQNIFSISADYQQPNVLPWGSLLWDVNGSFRDKTVSDLDPTSGQFFKMGSFWMWNASLKLESTDQTWSVNVFVRNLFDEKGITGGLPPSMAGRSNGYFVARPRTVGVGFSYSFK